MGSTDPLKKMGENLKSENIQKEHLYFESDQGRQV